jgi:hypothetical protein
MKITVLAALVMVAAAGASAARLREPTLKNAMETVQVCADNSGDSITNYLARNIATQMFAGIGVAIEWRHADACPAGALRISYSTSTPAKLMPGALAYALPYEGTRIVIFYDRVQDAVAEPRVFPALLAHVMTHEITHVLEGLARHSADGVMKAHWTAADYSGMSRKPLPFADEDVVLIHLGLEKRAAARRAAAPAASESFNSLQAPVPERSMLERRAEGLDSAVSAFK